MNQPDIKHLLSYLQSDSAQFRDQAIWQLSHSGESAVLPLIDALLSHEHPRVRQGAAQTLGLLEDERALQALITALSDPDPGVWSQATAALAKLGEIGQDALYVALKSKHQRTKQGAALALWRIKRAEKAFTILLQTLQDDEVLVRGAGITALWMQPDERALATLQIRLQREQGTMAHFILQALQAIGTPAAQATITHWIAQNQ